MRTTNKEEIAALREQIAALTALVVATVVKKDLVTEEVGTEPVMDAVLVEEEPIVQRPSEYIRNAYFEKHMYVKKNCKGSMERCLDMLLKDMFPVENEGGNINSAIIGAVLARIEGSYKQPPPFTTEEQAAQLDTACTVLTVLGEAIISKGYETRAQVMKACDSILDVYVQEIGKETRVPEVYLKRQV